MADDPAPTGVRDTMVTTVEEACNKEQEVEEEQFIITDRQTLDLPKMSNNKDPCAGMTFESYEEVYNFYKEYGNRKGFSARVGSSSKLKDGRWRRLLLNCCKSGKGPDDPCYQSRLSAKTGCQAKIIAKLWGDGLLHLEEVVMEHNHPTGPPLAGSFQWNTSNNESRRMNNVVATNASHRMTDAQDMMVPTMEEPGNKEQDVKDGHCVALDQTLDGESQPEMTYIKDPYVGMTFKSYDEVYCFYKEHAKSKGFGVRVGSSSKRKDGRCRRLLLNCRKANKGSNDPIYQLKPYAKTDCQAKIIVKLWGDGLLHLMKVVNEHNHPINPLQDWSFGCNTSFLPNGIKKRRKNKVEEDISNSVVAMDELERYDCLTMHCLQVAKLGAFSEDKFQLTMKFLGEMERRLLDYTTNATSKQDIPKNSKIPDPLQVKQRGRPPKGRKESEMEKSSKS